MRHFWGENREERLVVGKGQGNKSSVRASCFWEADAAYQRA